MKKIEVLDNKTINKIAAGEVVESPKSVVKELVENAIDAGATMVSVEIKEGGTSLIKITDNGKGIAKEDLKVAFLRHATSKLSQVEDLEHIFTLGFRGEALASIAAVAQVEMITKTEIAQIGTSIEIHGGEIKKIEDVATTQGTSVAVKNLFYNVIARRKFLKKPATESGYVSDLMNKLALGHPEVSFRYINNGTSMLSTPGNKDLKVAIFYVYGKEVANGMLPIYIKKNGYEISGMIGKPELSRGNRNYENLFINGRFIRNSIVASAVENGYKTRLMVGKFPIFILNLGIDPSQIDVNVHPAKLEVRFKNDDEIYEIFNEAILETLEKEVLIPQVSWDKKQKIHKEMPPVEQQKIEELSVEQPRIEKAEIKELEVEQKRSFVPQRLGSQSFGENKTINQLLKGNKKPINQVHQERQPFYKDEKEVSQKNSLLEKQEKALVAEYNKKNPIFPVEKQIEIMVEKQKESFFSNYKIIGQIFKTYWVIEQENSLYMIDQHAAHERILFEQLMNGLKKEKISSQRLLVPLMIQLTPMETVTLQENKELLEGFGFEIESFTTDTFALKAVPYILKEPSKVEFFMEILDKLEQEKIESLYDEKQNCIATMACKAAVKGHDFMTEIEAQGMIEQLLKLENPFSCPHGRPIIIEMTKYELEKKFKRIQD